MENIRRTRLIIPVLAFLIFVGPVYVTGCAVRKTGRQGYSVYGSNPLRNTRFWALQIGDEQPETIQRYVESHYDLLVLDDSGTRRGLETYDARRDIERLRKSFNSFGGAKLVVAFISVAEADNSRSYWRPDWTPGNPDWLIERAGDESAGRYAVSYWDDSWRSIVRDELDRIIDDGFDGACLAGLEAYASSAVAGAAQADGKDARDELVAFLGDLKRHAEQRKKGFILMAYGAAELAVVPGYTGLFKGIVQEAVWFDGSQLEKADHIAGQTTRSRFESDTIIRKLALWQSAKKPIFDVEYAEAPADVQRAYELGDLHGFKTYATLPGLDAPAAMSPTGY